MSRTSRSLILLGTAWVGAACATHTAPEGFLPSTSEAQREAYGGWVDAIVRSPNGLGRVAGELIAVTEDSLWVAEASGGAVIPTAWVVEGQLTGYDSRHGQVAGLTVLGVLSTASNGAFLIFTAPMWMIGGSLAAGSQSRVAMDDLPAAAWSDLSAFARFPQGMPPGIDLDELRAKR